MCNFLSAIGFKNTDIICDPSVDSHEDLINQYKLNDNSNLRNWVRLEYAPENKEDLSDITKYILSIDESPNPDWITDSIKEQWIDKLNLILKRLIITENQGYLSSGTYILSGKILINKLLYCRILNAGSSTIENAGHSTIENAGSSTIENAWNSTIENAGSSTIKDAGHSTIENAWYSTFENAGSSTIKDAGASTIENAGHSTIVKKNKAKISKK
jgi:hypothetical protein